MNADCVKARDSCVLSGSPTPRSPRHAYAAWRGLLAALARVATKRGEGLLRLSVEHRSFTLLSRFARQDVGRNGPGRPHGVDLTG